MLARAWLACIARIGSMVFFSMNHSGEQLPDGDSGAVSYWLALSCQTLFCSRSLT